MSNTAVITGFVSGVKRYDNKDGSVSLLFTVSSRTSDPKRYNEKGHNRDFFSVSARLEPHRAKFADFILDGRIVNVTGVPYFSYNEDKSRQYFNIKCDSANLIQLIRAGNEDDDESKSEATASTAPTVSTSTPAGAPPKKQGWG
jgi:hypothetical protein